jgi:cell division protein FtsN
MTSNNKRSLLKTGSKLRRSRRGARLPRIMWVAIAVCIIGAVLIFRDQGSNVPTGIGEYQTVVTAPEEEPATTQENGPRSGDVDISNQTTALTPEKPAGDAAATKDKTTSPPPVKQATTNPTPKTTTPKPAKPAPAPQLIKPSASGPYLVQTGSFGNRENADKETERLKRLGIEARVKVGNTSDDVIFYRVRIGYFKSRTEAQAFIRQNRKKLPGAIPAHR